MKNQDHICSVCVATTDSKFLFTSNWTGHIYQYYIGGNKGACLYKDFGKISGVASGITITHNNKFLFCGATNGYLLQFEIRSGKLMRSFFKYHNTMEPIISLDNQFLFTGDPNFIDNFKQYDIKNGSVVKTWDREGCAASSKKFTIVKMNVGKNFLIMYDNKFAARVEIWDITNEPNRINVIDGLKINLIFVSSDNNYLYCVRTNTGCDGCIDKRKLDGFELITSYNLSHWNPYSMPSSVIDMVG